MRLYPVKTRMVKPGDDLAELVHVALGKLEVEVENGDVLALASKIVSYAQGRVVKLSNIKPSKEATKLAKKYSLEPEFAELVLLEAGKVYGGVEKAVLTLKDCVMTPNAGIDYKNAPIGWAVLWPENLVEWLKVFRSEINRRTGKRLAVIVVDSGLIPVRIGTVGLALAVAGFKPITECRGRRDLYGRTVTITRHAVADDLASAAHLLMGETAEKVPVVLIKEAPVDFDDEVHSSSEMMMPFKECIFMNTLKGQSN